MIDKTKLPLVENDTMNEIHFEEVQIINDLSKLIESNQTDAITDQINMLIAHMQKHFSYEEDMMKSKRYQMYSVHQADHNKVLTETRYMLMDWRSAKDIDRLKEYFEEELPDWLDQHIKAMDTPMAEFIATT
jgi:hemerythrin